MNHRHSSELFGGEPVLAFADEPDRRSFLRWAGLVGVGGTLVAGGVGASSMLASAAPSAPRTRAQQASTDIDILNFALTLEHLEADFYTKGLEKGLITEERELELVEPVREHEQAHVAAVSELITTLGGKPVAKPSITYPLTTFASRLSFLDNASKFEETGVNAYHGQVPLISSGDVLAAAAAIAGVESRHAAVLASIIHFDPFPRPIEQPKSKEQILEEIAPFISGGK